MAVRTVNDVKLNVKPIFFCMEHKYYYEGPCRMASGQALEPGFDAMVNGKIYDGFEKAIQFNLKNDERFDVLDPVIVKSTDDWDIKEEWFDEMLADDNVADFYLVSTAFGSNTIVEEFALRTSKPIAANPLQDVRPALLRVLGTPRSRYRLRARLGRAQAQDARHTRREGRAHRQHPPCPAL